MVRSVDTATEEWMDAGPGKCVSAEYGRLVRILN